MSVSILHGSGHLICDGIDQGLVEYSVALADDGSKTSQRGKIWGNKAIIAASFNAERNQLRSPDGKETYRIEIEEINRDGSALFKMMADA